MTRRRRDRSRSRPLARGARSEGTTSRGLRRSPLLFLPRAVGAGRTDEAVRDQSPGDFQESRREEEPTAIAPRSGSRPNASSVIASSLLQTSAAARSSGFGKYALSLARVSGTTSLGARDSTPFDQDEGRTVAGDFDPGSPAAAASVDLGSRPPAATEGIAAGTSSQRPFSALELRLQSTTRTLRRKDGTDGAPRNSEPRRPTLLDAVGGWAVAEDPKSGSSKATVVADLDSRASTTTDGRAAGQGASGLALETRARIALPRFCLANLPPATSAAVAAEIHVATATHHAAHARSMRKAVQAALDGGRSAEELTAVDGSPTQRNVPRDDDLQGLHDANPNPAQQEHDEERVVSALAEASREAYPRLHRETCAQCRQGQRRLRAANASVCAVASDWRRLEELTAEADRRARRRRARQQAPKAGKAALAPKRQETFSGSRAEHATLAKLAAEQEVTDDVSELSKACYAYALWLRLQHGWRAGWGDRPPPARQIFNYASVDEPKHREGTDAAFCKLADAGAFGDPGFIEFLTAAPSSVTPFLAVTRAADRAKAAETGAVLKVRLCLDCSANFNDYVDRRGKQRFYYAGFEAVSEKIQAGDFVACGDLMSYYTQIALHPSMSKYLMSEVPQVSAATRRKYGIPEPEHWDATTNRWRGPFVPWRRLPFGVSRGCAIASMLTSEIVRIAEARGLRVASYIDDLLVMSTSAEGCAADFAALEDILRELGLRLQNAKQQSPAQSGNAYLGIEIDTVRQEYRVGADRQRRIAQEIRSVLAATHLETGRVKSLLGRLSWLCQVQRAGRARVRPLYDVIRGRASRERIQLSEQDREDLAWFLTALDDPAWVGSRWMKPRVASKHIVKSDAGDGAVGLLYRGRYAYYQLTEEERSSSSHARELLAAALALELFGPEAAGETLYFVTDNSGTAVTISSLGTSDRAGQGHCRRIGDASVRHDVDVAGIWQPREFNVVCDALSKLTAPPMEPCWVPFSREELAASKLDVGTGCLLLPRAYCPETRCYLGYAHVTGEC